MRWRRVKIDSIIEKTMSGGTPSTKTETYWNGNIPWITSAAILDKSIHSGEKYITEDGLVNSSSSIVPDNNIIIATRVGVGKIAVNHIDIAINQDLLGMILDKSKVYNEFLCWYMLSSPIQKYLKKIVRGTTIKGIIRSDLLNLEIPLPPLSEQRRIVEILDQADMLRKKRREALEKAERIIPALFYNIFSNPINKQMNWNIVELGELSEIVSGVTKGKKYNDNSLIEVPYLSVANVQDGYLKLEKVKTIAVKKSEIELYQLKTNDVLFTEGGDPDKLGRGTIWKEEIYQCIHQNHIFRVRITSEKILPQYLNALSSSNYGKSYFLLSSKQTTGIASINSKQLKRFPIPLPPIDLQLRFTYLSDKISSKLREIKNSNKQINTLFSTLIHRAFSGELTAKWREGRMKELLAEMEEQTKALNMIKTE